MSFLIDLQLQVISIMIWGIHESSSVLDSNNLAQDTCLMLVWLYTVRIGLLYVISGLGGSIMSGLFIQSSISVGASGALFGLLGGMLSELITNWTLYASKVFIELLSFEICTSEAIVKFWSGTLLGPIILQFYFCFNQFAALLTLVVIIVINLAVGILPHVDNFAHIGGFVSGFLLGFVFLIRPQFGWVRQRYAPSASAKPKFKMYQCILWVVSLILLIIG